MRAVVAAVLVAALGAAAWVGVRYVGSTTGPGSATATGTPSGPLSSSPVPAPTPSALWQLPTGAARAVMSPLASPPAGGSPPNEAGVRAKAQELLADPVFGGDQVALVVADPAIPPGASRTGGVLFDQRGDVPVPPASTSKLAVAVAALKVLGPQHRLTTRTVLVGSDEVVLVGGGDPTLAGPLAVGRYSPGFPEPARLSDLAAQTASALEARGLTAVVLRYDSHIFSGPTTAPGWKPTYVTEGDVAPVTALEVDEGITDFTRPARAGDPAGAATVEFAAQLRADGIAVTSIGGATVAGSAGAQQLAAVSSPPLAALVQRMLGSSDNDLAEALARQVALATGGPGTFAGGAAAVHATVAALGVDPGGLAMVDGSGLSTSDRVHVDVLVQLVRLVLADRTGTFSAIAEGLPVSSFSGTLTDRYTAPPAAAAAGIVHAKTGTLAGVVALVGYFTDASGRVLAFGVVVTGVAQGGITRTEAAVDRLTGGLASCGCQ